MVRQMNTRAERTARIEEIQSRVYRGKRLSNRDGEILLARVTSLELDLEIEKDSLHGKNIVLDGYKKVLRALHDEIPVEPMNKKEANVLISELRQVLGQGTL